MKPGGPLGRAGNKISSPEEKKFLSAQGRLNNGGFQQTANLLTSSLPHYCAIVMQKLEEGLTHTMKS